MSKFKIGDRVEYFDGIERNTGVIVSPLNTDYDCWWIKWDSDKTVRWVHEDSLTLLNTTKNNQDWIEWDGSSKYPEGVSKDTLVEVVYRDGWESNHLKASIFRWNHTNTGADIVKYRVVDSVNACLEHVPSKTKSDGSSSDYYKLTINGNPAEVEDVIYAMVGGDFILGNILKACRRMYLDSKGEGKEGIDMQYDANKIIYFANSYVKRFGEK